jgi:hypothetical protein
MKRVICPVKKFYNVQPQSPPGNLSSLFLLALGSVSCFHCSHLQYSKTYRQSSAMLSMMLTFESPEQKNLLNLVIIQSVTQHAHLTIWVLVVVTMKLHRSHAFKQLKENHGPVIKLITNTKSSVRKSAVYDWMDSLLIQMAARNSDGQHSQSP